MQLQQRVLPCNLLRTWISATNQLHPRRHQALLPRPTLSGVFLSIPATITRKSTRLSIALLPVQTCPPYLGFNIVARKRPQTERRSRRSERAKALRLVLADDRAGIKHPCSLCIWPDLHPMHSGVFKLQLFSSLNVTDLHHFENSKQPNHLTRR